MSWALSTQINKVNDIDINSTDDGHFIPTYYKMRVKNKWHKKI